MPSQTPIAPWRSPSKTEADSLQPRSAPAAPTILPSYDRYYWRKAAYTVEVAFLRQPQVVDSAKGIVWPAGLVTGILLYKYFIPLRRLNPVRRITYGLCDC